MEKHVPMPGLGHVFLHVALCNAVARLPPETPVAMRVRMSYQQGATEYDKVVKFERGDGTQTVVEFDIRRSDYRLQLEVPKYGCSATDFLNILPDQSRTVAETLDDGPVAPPKPVELMEGTAPLSFLYVKPTFVVFPKGLACDQPIPDALPSHFNVEYDQGAYYIQMDLLGLPPEPVIALRLRTPTGLAHYIHVPVQFPPSWGGWPGDLQFNVTEDEIDGLATEKTGVLLCPKLWETSVH